MNTNEVLNKLIAEIERRQQQLRICCGDRAFSGKEKRDMIVAYEELDRLRTIITSLRQEQPELPPIGYAETYYQKGLHDGIIKGQMEILKVLEEIKKKKSRTRSCYKGAGAAGGGFGEILREDKDFPLQDMCCEAYEKSGQGKWGDIREEAEQDMLMLQRKYWNLQHYGASYGLGYDNTADILFDMHKVLDHAIYLSMPQEKREEMRWTVMADKPMAFGEEELIKVKEINS